LAPTHVLPAGFGLFANACLQTPHAANFWRSCTEYIAIGMATIRGGRVTGLALPAGKVRSVARSAPDSWSKTVAEVTIKPPERIPTSSNVS
jgi:hypothetical protein